MKTPEDPSAIALPAAAAEASQELQLPSPMTPACSSGTDRTPGERKNYKALPSQVLGRPGAAIAAADVGVAGLDLHGDDLGTRGPARRRDPELARLVDAYVESRTTLNTRLAYELALQDFLRALKIRDAGELLAVRADQVVR
jgi:hypothetical protein